MSEGQLPIFNDGKSKDAVTYHSWLWDMAIFCWSGWDDQHLLPYVFHLLQGFLADLAWSLGKDATLNDILQTLDENYGLIMRFKALSKELYSLKQGSSKNIAEFTVHLLQQVQIHQTVSPGRIQLEHVEDMKHDHSMRVLIPNTSKMLAHKVDGDHPASYSDLLLAKGKLEKTGRGQGPSTAKDDCY